MAHELYLNNNNGNNHLSWSCQTLIKLQDACNGPQCPPRDGPKVQSSLLLCPLAPLPRLHACCSQLALHLSSAWPMPRAANSRTRFHLQPNIVCRWAHNGGFLGFVFLTEFVTTRRLRINTHILATTDSVGCQSKCQASLRP